MPCSSSFEASFFRSKVSSNVSGVFSLQGVHHLRDVDPEDAAVVVGDAFAVVVDVEVEVGVVRVGTEEAVAKRVPESGLPVRLPEQHRVAGERRREEDSDLVVPPAEASLDRGLSGPSSPARRRTSSAALPVQFPSPVSVFFRPTRAIRQTFVWRRPIMASNPETIAIGRRPRALMIFLATSWTSC